MKGLLLRLSAVDADAEAAVRVIAYFDTLVERGATPTELVRAAAALAECPAGLDRPGAEPLRFRPDGSPPDGEVATGSVEIGPGAGRVWLARDGGPGPLDDLVLERLAISARLLVGPHRRTPAPDLADPGLVELVLAAREAPADRARASGCGLDTEHPVRVFAVAAELDPGTAAVALVARGRGLPGHPPDERARTGFPLALPVDGPRQARLGAPTESGCVGGRREHGLRPVRPAAAAPSA